LFLLRELGMVKSQLEMLISRLESVKSSLEAVISLLEMQNQVPWVDLIQLFCTLSNQFSSLQGVLKSNDTDEFDLRKYLVTPYLISLESDPHLLKLTEGRIVGWNHEVVANYLRTKFTPELEDDTKLSIFQSLENEFAGKPEYIMKQTKLFNSHIEMLCSKLKQQIIYAENRREPQQMPNELETSKIVSAILLGKNIEPKNLPDGRTGTPSQMKK